jgi:hypothetical protein
VGRGHPVAILVATALIAGVSGCGGDGDSSDDVTSNGAPSADEFPAPGGKTLEQIYAQATPDEDLVVAPAGQAFSPGRNRFSFGLFTAAGDQITDADVALYVAHGPSGAARGPYPARVESLETDPGFVAQTTADDPDSAKVVYVANLRLDRPGEWRLVALRDEDGELTSARTPSILVDDYASIPDVGERAPAVHTPTTADVGDVGEIDTRVPHDTMHDLDLADVIGEQPAVLLFATPALCVSRVCGPVVDVAEQLKAEYGDQVAFIHMEIWANNTFGKKLRPQVEAYGLRTEPWLFVIDESGRVSTRIEGAFSADELEAALQKVT